MNKIYFTLSTSKLGVLLECGNLSNGNLSILSVCLLDAGLNTYLSIQIYQLVTKGDFTVRSLMD